MIPEAVWRADTRHLDPGILVFAELPSTNDYALSLGVDPTNGGTAVVARFQSQGRGQYGRTWQSRPGDSLLMSVAVHPPAELRRPVVLTAWAAVAVARVVERLTGHAVRMKWPNDLLVGGQKVCGILIEQSQDVVVVGVGLNLNQTRGDFDAAGLPAATSLALLAGSPFALEVAARACAESLDATYGTLLSGATSPLESAWRDLLGLVSCPVTLELADGTLMRGMLRDLSWGGLEVDTGDMVPRLIRPEWVRHVAAD